MRKLTVLLLVGIIIFTACTENYQQNEEAADEIIEENEITKTETEEYKPEQEQEEAVQENDANPELEHEIELPVSEYFSDFSVDEIIKINLSENFDTTIQAVTPIDGRYIAVLHWRGNSFFYSVFDALEEIVVYTKPLTGVSYVSWFYKDKQTGSVYVYSYTDENLGFYDEPLENYITYVYPNDSFTFYLGEKTRRTFDGYELGEQLNIPGAEELGYLGSCENFIYSWEYPPVDYEELIFSTVSKIFITDVETFETRLLFDTTETFGPHKCYPDPDRFYGFWGFGTAISPDTKHIALTGDNDTLYILNTENGKYYEIYKFSNSAQINFFGNDKLLLTGYSGAGWNDNAIIVPLIRD